MTGLFLKVQLCRAGRITQIRFHVSNKKDKKRTFRYIIQGRITNIAGQRQRNSLRKPTDSDWRDASLLKHAWWDIKSCAYASPLSLSHNADDIKRLLVVNNVAIC